MKKFTLCLLIMMSVVLVFCCAFDKNEKTGKTELVGISNPWVETDEKGLMQTLGLEFNIPEEAEDVMFRMNESEQLAEMQFVLYKMPFTARIKPSGLEMEDISGLNYKWEFEKESNDHWFRDKIMKARDGKNTVEAFLWFDIVPGLTYSISTEAPDLDGFDIIAVAQMVWHQAQGDD